MPQSARPPQRSCRPSARIRAWRTAGAALAIAAAAPACLADETLPSAPPSSPSAATAEPSSPPPPAAEVDAPPAAEIDAPPAAESDARPAAEADAPPAAEPAKATWALGVGGTVFVSPDFVGSDRERVRALPIPYIEYESPRFQVDRTGASGALFRWERLRAEISGSGSLPVDSSDNKERRGMPDLDTVLELGPALKIELWRGADAINVVHLELPVRSALALSLEGVEPVGWTATPNLEWRRREPLDDGHWTIRLSAGPQFNDGEYNNYYYGVRRRDARDNRPAYGADAGYGGFRVSGALGRRWGDLWVGSYARYVYLDGAVFSESPLVRTDHALFTGVAAAWVFASSADEPSGGGDKR